MIYVSKFTPTLIIIFVVYIISYFVNEGDETEKMEESEPTDTNSYIAEGTEFRLPLGSIHTKE